MRPSTNYRFGDVEFLRKILLPNPILFQETQSSSGSM
jgi:hypothetical protein